MRYVRQQSSTDCGISCLAMVTGVSYERALKAVFPQHEQKKVFRTRSFDLWLGARRLGFCADSRLQRRNVWPTVRAICKVDYGHPHRHHWIAYDPKGPKFHDPWSKDITEWNVTSYMRVWK